MKIQRTLATPFPAPKSQLRSEAEKEYAPLVEQWDVGGEVFESTEQLVQSQKTFENKVAKYTYVTRQAEVKNPTLVRTGRALLRGATGAMMLGAVETIAGATAGLVGAGIGFAIGATDGAMEDPTLIDRGSMVGVLNKDEQKSTFGHFAKDKDGNFTGEILGTRDLAMGPLVTPRGGVSGEFVRVGLGAAAGALIGLGTGATGSFIKGGSMAGGLAGVAGGIGLGFLGSSEEESRLAKFGHVAGGAALLGAAGFGAGGMAGILVGMAGTALNLGPVGHILGGAVVGGMAASVSNMDLG